MVNMCMYISAFMLNIILDSMFTEAEETGSTSIKQALEAFLNNLPTCINREMIDNAAVEFVVCLNTKTSRRKLIKLVSEKYFQAFIVIGSTYP